MENRRMAKDVYRAKKMKQNRFLRGKGDCVTLRQLERIFSERF